MRGEEYKKPPSRDQLDQNKADADLMKSLFSPNTLQETLISSS